MLNYSGCGNTVNVNDPVVMQMVIHSLVKWVTEFHVDGFRFDLASAMCRGELMQCAADNSTHTVEDVLDSAFPE